MEIVTRAQFNELVKPCVYILAKDDGSILYVGASSRGYERVFSSAKSNHPQRRAAFGEFDRMKIVFFSNVSEAFEAERATIHLHHPRYNVGCEYCSLKKLGSFGVDSFQQLAVAFP